MDDIREGIARLFKIAREEGALRKWADGKDDADEALSYLQSQGFMQVEEVVDKVRKTMDKYDFTTKHEVTRRVRLLLEKIMEVN